MLRQTDAARSRQAMLQLHAAVALFGLAGLIGKATAASPLMIVCGRTVFGTAAFTVLFLTGILQWPVGPQPRLSQLAGLGVLLAVHWISFFQAIQLSSVAVALLSFSSFPVFVTILEPLLFEHPRRGIDAVTSILVLVGVVVLVPKFDMGDRTTAGVCWGIFSGLSFAGLTLLNRHLAVKFSPAVVAAGQTGFAALVLACLLPTYYEPLTTNDWLLLVVLGVVFTALAHFLFIQSLIDVRAQLASIVTALEPIYGGLFAWLVLGETPSLRTCCGGGIILGAVLIGAWQRPVTPAGEQQLPVQSSE